MKRSAALVALALWLVVGSAHAQVPFPFDYRCDTAAAAATAPAALPEEGWRKASDEEIALASHAPPCWLRVAPASLAGRTLRIRPATPMAVTVYSQTGQVLASVRPSGEREQAIIGSTGILFPTLRAEDGTIYLRVQPATDELAVSAVDLPAQMQKEHDRDFFRFARGMICAVAAVIAAVLGWRSRDRAQFVFAALFAWSALEEWMALSPVLAPGIAVPRWWVVTWLPVINALWLLAADQVLRLA